MRHTLRRSITFRLERLVQRGALFQLFLMAVLVVLVAVAGGLSAWAFTSEFGDPLAGIWWAFLRLTDPGYLGDDKGITLRILSTVVTVLGYVLFMGSLIAILTQSLSRSIRNLESGLTPLVMKDHVVILGWTNRTPETVAQLLRARGRMQRFLARRQIKDLRIVVLADTVDAALRLQLRDYLGVDWSERQVFLRSGSALQPSHLERVDLERAAVVIVPGADFAEGGAEMNDTRVAKIVLTVDALFGATAAEERPHIVAEIFDPLKAPLVQRSVDSPFELIASDQILSRMIYQSVRHHEVVRVLLDLFNHQQGNSIYVRGFPELAGSSLRSLIRAFPRAIVLGVIRRREGALEVALDPTADVEIGVDDDLVLLGLRYDDCQPDATLAAAEGERAICPLPPPATPEVHHVLVLGWSHKIGPLLRELSSVEDLDFEVTILSKVAIADRHAELQNGATDRVVVHHVRGDYATADSMRAVDPAHFDSIVFLASGWMRSPEEADARTILGYLLLKSMLGRSRRGPKVLVELLDPDNGNLLDANRNAVLVSPQVLSHLLAHFALRPELNAVFDALLGAGGTELGSRTAAALGLGGRTLTFTEIQDAAASCGCAAVGLLLGDSDSVDVNPDRDRSFTLADEDRVVLLERSAAGAS